MWLVVFNVSLLWTDVQVCNMQTAMAGVDAAIGALDDLGAIVGVTADHGMKDKTVRHRPLSLISILDAPSISVGHPSGIY